MPTLSKSSGIAGLPSGTKAKPRVDFRVDDFSIAIETKGYRIAWSRAGYCPCLPVNEQTDQADPNCLLCEGHGWILFSPAVQADYKIVGELTALQKVVVGSEASVIVGLTTGLYAKDEPHDLVTRRLEGKMQVTVRPENRLGYYDRIVSLDTNIVYSQIVKSDGTTLLEGRYPIVDINLLRDESTVYQLGTDFVLEDGKVRWTAAPSADTRFSLHYLTYPHWRVVEHPHVTRATLGNRKSAKPTLPTGTPVDLPIQAVCQYEWLL